MEELLLKSDRFVNRSDERVYNDLRDSLEYMSEMEKPSRNYSKLNVTIELKKNAFTHKMRLPVWGYTNGEYLYMLLDGGLRHEKSIKKNVYQARNLAFVQKKKIKNRIFIYSWLPGQTFARIGCCSCPS